MKYNNEYKLSILKLVQSSNKELNKVIPTLDFTLAQIHEHLIEQGNVKYAQETSLYAAMSSNPTDDFQKEIVACIRKHNQTTNNVPTQILKMSWLLWQINNANAQQIRLNISKDVIKQTLADIEWVRNTYGIEQRQYHELVNDVIEAIQFNNNLN